MSDSVSESLGPEDAHRRGLRKQQQPKRIQGGRVEPWQSQRVLLIEKQPQLSL